MSSEGINAGKYGLNQAHLYFQEQFEAGVDDTSRLMFEGKKNPNFEL